GSATAKFALGVRMCQAAAGATPRRRATACSGVILKPSFAPLKLSRALVTLGAVLTSNRNFELWSNIAAPLECVSSRIFFVYIIVNSCSFDLCEAAAGAYAKLQLFRGMAWSHRQAP